MRAKLFALAALAGLSLATSAKADPIFVATYRDTNVSIEKRVIDTYRAALESKEDNAIKTTIHRLAADMAGFGKVQMPNKDNLLLLARGLSVGTEHDISTRVRTGKYLLTIPLATVGAGNSVETGAILAVYFNVQVGKKVEISIENFVEIVDRQEDAATPAMEPAL